MAHMSYHGRHRAEDITNDLTVDNSNESVKP